MKWSLDLAHDPKWRLGPLFARLAGVLGILLSLIVTAAAPASAEKTDRILLSNATEIIGEVESLEHGQLRVSTEYMRTVELDWEQVVRIESTLDGLHRNYPHLRKCCRSLRPDQEAG